ncbi:MAG: iron-containing redox enzyme family protein [Cellvibrionales bacterium]|nr:iron-containing redox enzyme family protein [Cellvibrionales bacterium]
METVLKSDFVFKEDNLKDWVEHLLSLSAQELAILTGDHEARKKIIDCANSLVDSAYTQGNKEHLVLIHKVLSQCYDQEFSIPSHENINADRRAVFSDICGIFETAIIDAEAKEISESSITGYPTDGQEYINWLHKLIGAHTSSIHPLYNKYIAKFADAEDLAFYLAQETTLDPRFDDILALMQIGTGPSEKLEIASNYWDEMGNGKQEDVHTRLFSKALDAVGVTDAFIKENILDEAIISGNLSACFALHRRHYYKAVGYFGVTEYLAPRRFKHVVKAWERNNLPEKGIEYHKLHIHIDTVHAKAWLNNVIAPLVEKDPRLGREIALGALIRLNSSERYLDIMLDHFTESKNNYDRVVGEN